MKKMVDVMAESWSTLKVGLKNLFTDGERITYPSSRNSAVLIVIISILTKLLMSYRSYHEKSMLGPSWKVCLSSGECIEGKLTKDIHNKLVFISTDNGHQMEVYALMYIAVILVILIVSLSCMLFLFLRAHNLRYVSDEQLISLTGKMFYEDYEENDISKIVYISSDSSFKILPHVTKHVFSVLSVLFRSLDLNREIKHKKIESDTNEAIIEESSTIYTNEETTTVSNTNITTPAASIVQSTISIDDDIPLQDDNSIKSTIIEIRLRHATDIRLGNNCITLKSLLQTL